MWLPALEEMTLSFSILMQQAGNASMQCDQSIKVAIEAIASTRGDPLLRLYLTNSWTAFKHVSERNTAGATLVARLSERRIVLQGSCASSG